MKNKIKVLDVIFTLAVLALVIFSLTSCAIRTAQSVQLTDNVQMLISEYHNWIVFISDYHVSFISHSGQIVMFTCNQALYESARKKTPLIIRLAVPLGEKEFKNLRNWLLRNHKKSEVYQTKAETPEALREEVDRMGFK